MLLGTLGATLLRILLTGKGAMATNQGWAGKGKGINRAGKGIARGNKMVIVIKWTFTASYFNKLWNTKILSKWA